MISIKDKISDNEVILYQAKKKKWFIPAMMVYCPLLMLIALSSIVPCYKNMFLGAISFDSDTTYFNSITSMILLVPLAILIPISYLFNKFIITDKRIYIRKGLTGSLHIINYSDIFAYQHIHQEFKGISSHFIHIFLISGKRINSGNLYIKDKDVTELNKIMQSKITRTISSGQQYKEARQKKFESCNNETRRNWLLPVISLSPFIIALIMLLLYFTGVNKYGEQIDIEVYGSFESKTLEDDNGEKIWYDFIRIEEENNKRYDFSEDKNIYAMFKKGDKILIKAKKGTLGIVYDQRVYTQ